MGKLDYYFDDGNPPPRPGGRGRFILIFLVVTAITGLIIWLLLPGGKLPGGTPEKPVEVKPVEEKPAEEKPAETKTEKITEQIIDVDAPEEKPAEVKPAEVKPGEVKPAEEKPAEMKPAEMKPAEMKPAEEKPAAEKTGETPSVKVPEEWLRLAAAGDWNGLRSAALTAVTAAAPGSEAYVTAGRQLALANRKLLETGKHPGIVIHTVVPRDGLIRLGRRYHTTLDSIRQLNALKKDNITVGRKLRIFPGPFLVTADRGAGFLTLERELNGVRELFGIFPIYSGQNHPLPAGEYRLVNRLVHPDWRAPYGEIYTCRDAEYPLGPYCLGIAGGAVPADRGFCFHGTGRASGKTVNRNGIRLEDEDITLLYRLLPVQTAVVIK